MTIDDPVDQLGKDLTLKDTLQQEKKSFQVVLVDIEQAAHNRVVRCVKKPLGEKDLKFVALSYRWGELHETMIDTKVGYIASITSFDLNDFYSLCLMMTLESDMKHIKYVWVDAICVDQRPSKRKATIYQMSNIYERATYILAVPDLHLTYLKGVSLKNMDTIKGCKTYSEDIYHLIHGHTEKLAARDERFLNIAEVPKDPPELRPLLLKYTDHFADSFMNYQEHLSGYCPVLALDHICETTNVRRHPWQTGKKGNIIDYGDLHQCDQAFCPLSQFSKIWGVPSVAEYQVRKFKWKSRVLERSDSIRQAMEFLTGLIKDWSSRVWVISEYNTAKKKNNLKFWFVQLDFYQGFPEDFTFFKFDFHDSPFSDKMINAPYYNESNATNTRAASTNPVYIQFHYTMIRQLRQQTFLDMILSSKASRNEDRFYSILPLSQYHERKSEVAHWGIDNMLSVKLRLYDIMNIRDKLSLFFWSSGESVVNRGLLPTFATSTLSLEFSFHIMSCDFCNFDLNNPSTIMLYHHQQTNTCEENDDDNDDDDGNDTKRYFLRLKPKEYKVATRDRRNTNRDILIAECIPILKDLGIENASTHTLDVVSIPLSKWQCPQSFTSKNSNSLGWKHGFIDRWHNYFVTLVGCFVSNTWITSRYSPELQKGQRVEAGDDRSRFDGRKFATIFDIY
ncbi:hypothetical protein BCR42DRAFT_456411 [Absidia repens]|uniref:Heterokaryon incompatibility domain-containing protein n=1 Tax=Absidia repens TaxID=90262 RepID=A0A1X2HZY3_9FUNG|nr:hypothetical protein BCR42DRAFT_456411 [Absidia repens]